MNRWLKLAVYSFVGIIVSVLFLNLITPKVSNNSNMGQVQNVQNGINFGQEQMQNRMDFAQERMQNRMDFDRQQMLNGMNIGRQQMQNGMNGRAQFRN